ncbi:hypothetical protein [Micromonospora profundi]|uniref:hypothetical protein n=1 Tax=Micromonospora profundi TaxID=1420889 RepID=UPI0036464E66
MFLLKRLAGILHLANRRPVEPAPLPRVRDMDGPTIRLPRLGQPGVNVGRAYTGSVYVSRTGRHRSPDRNRVPARLTRQHVA